MKQYPEAVAFFYQQKKLVLHMEGIGKEACVYCEDLDVLGPGALILFAAVTCTSISDVTVFFCVN